MEDHHGIKLLPSANIVNPVDIKKKSYDKNAKVSCIWTLKCSYAKDFILLPRLRNMKS